jgi:hypothetical protein
VKSPSPQKRKISFFFLFFFFSLIQSLILIVTVTLSLSPTPTKIYSTPALKSPRRFTQIINHTLPLILILSLTFIHSFFFLSLTVSLCHFLTVIYSHSQSHSSSFSLPVTHSHCLSFLSLFFFWRSRVRGDRQSDTDRVRDTGDGKKSTKQKLIPSNSPFNGEVYYQVHFDGFVFLAVKSPLPQKEKSSSFFFLFFFLFSRGNNFFQKKSESELNMRAL